ncbi:hypothetical protein ACKKBG_A26815 [Auxenochlorella protothecoides x Auxenochlorella symbiontica]
MAPRNAAWTVLVLLAALTAPDRVSADDALATALEFCNVTASDVAPELRSSLDFVGPLRTVAIPGAEVGYHRFGNTTTGRPPLVLVAGLGSTMSFWSAELLESLAEDQEVIIFDNRGMGYTKDFTTKPLTVPLMANDTLAFVEALELGVKPNLLGLSLGGFIATASAGLHGEHYNKVVIVSGSAGSPESEAPSLQAQQVFSDPNATELDQLNTSFPLQFPVAEAACRRFIDPDSAVYDTYNGTTFGRQALAILDYFYVETDVWDAVPGIDNDLLLVGGEDDIVVPIQSLRAIAERVPAPWLVVFKEAGHAAMNQYLPTFLQILDTFLSFSTDV